MTFEEFRNGELLEEFDEEQAEEMARAFVSFAAQHGISLEHHDDWGAWWNCFATGFVAGDSQELTG